MSTLTTTNLKNPSSGSNNIVLGTGGDTTITNNLTVSGTGNNSIAGTFQFNSGYGSVATAYGCRAWVNFNGTGTVAIRSSGNVISITDNGTGQHTVNFTTELVDANYCIMSMAESETAAASTRNATVFSLRSGTTPTASACSFICKNGSTAQSSQFPADVDRSFMHVAIFR